MYKIFGYDKDNDVFVEFGTDKKYNKAVSSATHLSELMEKGELKRDNGEPIDWIEVYQSEGPNEKLVWASYRDVSMNERGVRL